eukprot:365750-Chlamydomonas_euryale.AAC.5
MSHCACLAQVVILSARGRCLLCSSLELHQHDHHVGWQVEAAGWMAGKTGIAGQASQLMSPRRCLFPAARLRAQGPRLWC